MSFAIHANQLHSVNIKVRCLDTVLLLLVFLLPFHWEAPFVEIAKEKRSCAEWINEILFKHFDRSYVYAKGNERNERYKENTTYTVHNNNTLHGVAPAILTHFSCKGIYSMAILHCYIVW